MTLAALINRPCVVITRSGSGTDDDYGNEIDEELNIETTCEAQPRSAVEPENAGEFSDEDWVGFFLPADQSFLDTASAVWIPGFGEFEVTGRPPLRRNPRTTQEAYVRANLKRTAGPEDDESL